MGIKKGVGRAGPMGAYLMEAVRLSNLAGHHPGGTGAAIGGGHPPPAAAAMKNHIIGCRNSREQRAVFQDLQSQRQTNGALAVATQSAKNTSHGQSSFFCSRS